MSSDVLRLPLPIDLPAPATVTHRARFAYDLAADSYDDAANGFWSRSGERTIDRLGLQPGWTVLDLACGSGASTIPAARRVGPTGKVVGIDLSERMLENGRRKAGRLGLDSIEFRQGDMTEVRYPDASFDAVICVFGVSLAPDMEGFVADLWRMVRPGGRLAITTWGPRLWSPMYEVWRETIRTERPELVIDFHPWERLTTPSAISRLLGDAGIDREHVRILPEFDVWPLRSGHDWCSMVMGSGLRWTIEQLSPDAKQRVRAANLAYVKRHDVQAITCNVLYTTVTKPAAD